MAEAQLPMLRVPFSALAKSHPHVACAAGHAARVWGPRQEAFNSIRRVVVTAELAAGLMLLHCLMHPLHFLFDGRPCPTGPGLSAQEAGEAQGVACNLLRVSLLEPCP